MSDTNKDGLINSDEAMDAVREEKIVNEALVNKEITDEEAATIETLDALEKEAQKIEMEESMGGSAEVADIKSDDITIDIPEEKKAQPEEQSQVSSTSTPHEVTAEASKEPTSEVSQEGSREVDELTSEFKKPLI
jgi:hypothetical protein